MGEMLAVWMVLPPIAALLTPFVVLPRFVALRDRQEVRIAAAGGLMAVLYITNAFSVTGYTRAAVGGEVIRLIPLLQFDSALLATTWVPDQLLIGVTSMLFMSVIFSRNLRNAFWVTFVLFGVGIEWNQALANMSGITPPFRIDAHDIAMRTAGIALALQFVQRLRGRLIAREQILRRASAAAGETLVVLGSLYLVGEVLARLRGQGLPDAWQDRLPPVR